MTVPFNGEDTESGICGIQAFLDAQAISAASDGGLRHAAYWIALRQEILTAFSKQRPFRLPLGPCEPYRSFEPTDDHVWADRLVIHCADVLQYCFGSDVESTHVATADITSAQHISRYEELFAFDKSWEEFRPRSFLPIYAREANRSQGEAFPEIWYLNHCHVAGIQYLELARILLVIHDPKVPRMGPSHRAAMHSVDQTLRSIVLRICGIALSNQYSPPGLVVASVAIRMCGDRFTTRVEQEALLALLVMLEENHAWPTQSTQQLLKKAWGWGCQNLSDINDA